MKSSRLSAIVLIGGVLAGGLALQTADRTDTNDEPTTVPVLAGMALPAAAPAGTLSSTWYCAAGSATEDGIADHVLLIANPTDQARTATVTPITGFIAPPVEAADPGATTTSTEAPTTTTVPDGEPTDVEIPAQSRVDVTMSELVDTPLAGAIVEVDGGQIAVEHQVTSDGGRATAPCSATTATEWSFPWGVTSRGARELLVFMNPFPDDATIDIDFATDEGVHDTLRFRGFVVPGRSVVGAYIDEDVTRKQQVSAQVHVRSGRLVVDRLQTFNGTDTREGITLSLGAPVPAETWIFPDGKVTEGVSEQFVVYNPSEGVAEVEVEVRLDDPETNGTPEPFSLTVLPGHFSLVDVAGEDGRVPVDVAHSAIVRSLNGVPIAADRVVVASEPASTVGIAAMFGSPVAAPTWYLSGGGLSDERDEWITVFNDSNDEAVTFSVTALADGQTLAVQDLQDLTIPPGGRRSIQLSGHTQRERLPLVVEGDGPIVVERGLYRVGGRGISQAIGIPLAVGVVVPDPVNG